MSPRISPAQTRLMTGVRLVADRFLTPCWPEMSAVVTRRKVLVDGIRYSLVLPRLDLRLEFRLAHADSPLMLAQLSARRRNSVERAASVLARPLDSGFERLAFVPLYAGSEAAVAAALLELRTRLWDHPSLGHEATAIRPAA